MAPQSLFAQLLPAGLDEMETRMRARLLGCPHLSLGDEEGAKETKQSSGSLVAPKPSGQGKDSHRVLSLDVSGFQPEELTVRLEGRKLTVSGKHQQRSESADGCFSQEYRELHREVLLPEDTNLEAMACALTQEGHLRIEAPRLAALPPPKETTIPISISKAAQASGEDVGAEGSK